MNYIVKGQFPMRPREGEPESQQQVQPVQYQERQLQQPKPLQLSRKDKLLRATRDIINSYFYHVVNPHNTHFLVEKSTNEAYLAEGEVLVGRIKKLAADFLGFDLGEGTVHSAIRIVREEQGNGPEGLIYHPVSPVFGRTLYHNDGSIYLRTTEGYIQFDSKSSQYYQCDFPPLPVLLPENCLANGFRLARGGTKAEDVLSLFELENLPKDEDILIITWMLNALLPGSQQVLLELTGSSSSGRSRAQNFIKQLIDPSSMLLNSDTPKSVGEVHSLAQKDFLISLNNVDKLKNVVQRELSQIMVGRAIDWKSKRRKFDAKVDICCPVILNSLESVVSIPELAEKTLTIELPELDDPEGTPVSRASEENVFNGLIYLLSVVNFRLESISLTDKAMPGWKSFSLIGCIVAEALGREVNEFREQFNRSMHRRRISQAEEMPVVTALMGWWEIHEGEMSEFKTGQWLELLEETRPAWADEAIWPHNPRSLGAALKQATPVLKGLGLELKALGKRGSHTYWKLSNVS
jgi:hypothetical protein